MIDVVVAYDRDSARMLEQFVYVDEPAAAFAKRLDREIAYRERCNVEVVLLNAVTMDDLKVSHARYFDPGAISAGRLKAVSEELRRLAS